MQEKAWTAQQLNGIQLPVYRQSWRVVACFDYQVDTKQRNGFDGFVIGKARYCISIVKWR